MVLFVWVCIVFMNLFICSLWLSQLPSAARLCFINNAWHSKESLLQTCAHSILICWGFQKKIKHILYVDINTIRLKVLLCSYCVKSMHIRKSFSCRRQPLLLLLLLLLQQPQKLLFLNNCFTCFYCKHCLAKVII